MAGLLAPTAGTISLGDTPLATTVAGRTREQLRRIQIVFQNADVALNPAHDVGEILGRVLRFYHGTRGIDAQRRVAELLDLIKLPATVAGRRCDELSGGQKQRVNLARALAAEPDVILCDEVTSALDTVVRGAILDLLAELRRDLGVAYLFISHDIATVKALCDEIVVLYKGTRVESGVSRQLCRRAFPSLYRSADRIGAGTKARLARGRECPGPRTVRPPCRAGRSVSLPAAVSGCDHGPLRCRRPAASVDGGGKCRALPSFRGRTGRLSHAACRR